MKNLKAPADDKNKCDWKIEIFKGLLPMGN